MSLFKVICLNDYETGTRCLSGVREAFVEDSTTQILEEDGKEYEYIRWGSRKN